MKNSGLKNVGVFLIGLISFLYLINPGMGFLEFLPDNLPFIGNLDEGVASFLLLSSLAYFGVDLRRIFANFFFKEKDNSKFSQDPRS